MRLDRLKNGTHFEFANCHRAPKRIVGTLLDLARQLRVLELSAEKLRSHHLEVALDVLVDLRGRGGAVLGLLELRGQRVDLGHLVDELAGGG